MSWILIHSFLQQPLWLSGWDGQRACLARPSCRASHTRMLRVPFKTSPASIDTSFHNRAEPAITLENPDPVTAWQGWHRIFTHVRNIKDLNESYSLICSGSGYFHHSEFQNFLFLLLYPQSLFAKLIWRVRFADFLLPWIPEEIRVFRPLFLISNMLLRWLFKYTIIDRNHFLE